MCLPDPGSLVSDTASFLSLDVALSFYFQALVTLMLLISPISYVACSVIDTDTSPGQYLCACAVRVDKYILCS